MDNYDDKLDVAGGEAEVFDSEVRLFLKVFSVTFILCAVLASFWWYRIENKTSFNKETASAKREAAAAVYADVKAFHDKIVIWNQLFDEGQYELLVTDATADYNSMLYNWKHYKFCSLYKDVLEMDKTLEEFEPGKSQYRYKYTNVLHTCINLCFTLQKPNFGLEGKDAEIIKEFREEKVDYALSVLGVSMEDFERLYLKATAKDYIDYTAISEYAEERWPD